ncbi:hypothetical protein EC973_001316 [Apophysomyces ossiformis]|uniref:Threonine/serine exporter-like N-terminal domain-containing protein n=1 Tax=Apophysomyces ossiformis TaxID=679940 RepID=A0A8H7BYK4_9FUNG|nr:hypothetical protein EC973_001316 [Apophysomyces ossiformis]
MDHEKESNKTGSLHTSASWPHLPELDHNVANTPRHPLEISSDIEYEYEEEEEDDEKKVDLYEEEEKDKIGDMETTETLVEAALDHVEAKDRHVRFQAHVVESATLVQRMLSTRMGEAETNGRRATESTIEIHPRSGSILASLMMLEQQRLQQQSNHSATRRKKKKKKLRPKSLYSLGSSFTVQQPSSPSGYAHKLKRPPLVNRPRSWLTTVTSSNHLVPSLEKRKKVVQSISRRSSMDSAFTTASQFEPITLEDRIRITFEIANILQKQEFLRKLAKSLMLYGCPAHRLEYIMRRVSRTIGAEAEYVYIPNIMFLSFFDQTTHTTETHFIRQPQMFDMHKLGEVYRLEKLVSHGEVSVDEALEFIDKVADEPQFYPVFLNPFVYALASFCGAVMFFGGRFKEAGLSAALAMFFAVYELYTGRFLSFQPIWEITVCILIGFVSTAVGRYDMCFTPIAFSSFIIILPGYSMAVAIVELVSRQLVSGIVRMVYAILYSFLLGYGVSMGRELYGTIDPVLLQQQGQSTACKNASKAGTCITVENQWYYFMTVPLFAVAYCVYLRARPPRWPIMIFVSICGFVTNWALACHASAPAQVLQVVPSFAVGLIGNLLTKFTGKMSFDAVLLAIFYLTPGSLGLKAALGLFGAASNTEFASQGAGFALSMIESAIGITVGLFVATLIVYPKGSQHTPLMSF